MKLKSLAKVAAILSLSSLMTGCLMSAADQGQAVVYVKKPMLFGTPGVSKHVDGTGLWFHAPTTDAVIVDVTQQEEIENFIDLATSDKVPVDFEAAVQFIVDQDNSWALIEEYRTLGNWYRKKFKQVFRETVRNFARGQSSESMMYNPETLKKMGQSIQEEMQAFVDKDPKADIKIVRVLIGKANPPQPLADEIGQTAKQKQRKKTEDQKRAAEVARKLAEEARADADHAYQNKMKMTTQEYLASRQLDNQAAEIANQELAIKEGRNVTFLIGSSTAQPVKVID